MTIGQTTVHKPLHRKLKTEQTRTTQKTLGVISDTFKG